MLQALHKFPILLTLYAGFGVLIHDTQLDSAALTAIKNPAYGDHAAAKVEMATRTAHVHVEHITLKDSLRNQQPAVHPRNEAEKKVATQRRTPGNNTGFDFIWPWRR